MWIYWWCQSKILTTRSWKCPLVPQFPVWVLAFDVCTYDKYTFTAGIDSALIALVKQGQTYRQTDSRRRLMEIQPWCQQQDQLCQQAGLQDFFGQPRFLELLSPEAAVNMIRTVNTCFNILAVLWHICMVYPPHLTCLLSMKLLQSFADMFKPGTNNRWKILLKTRFNLGRCMAILNRCHSQPFNVFVVAIFD